MPSASIWKTVFLPPFFALALYFLTTYVLLPIYYHHRGRYSQYVSLPASLSHDIPRALLQPRTLQDRLFARLFPSTWRRRESAASDGGASFGDEELEEGLITRDRAMNEGGGGEVGEERRLSRELEGGFKDDSSDSEGDDRGRI